jgi:mono/diheme cytochrome c family protein
MGIRVCRKKLATPLIGLGDHWAAIGTITVLGGRGPEVLVIMRRFVLLGLLILLISAAGAQDKPQANKAPAQRAVAAGKQTYMHYCASCHGVDARGDGPAAFMLKTTPPDLTALAKRHGGKFPYEYVSDVLRFGTRIRSHGSSDMPIWGPIFGSMDNYDKVAVRKRIKNLTDYLASLRQKEL